MDTEKAEFFKDGQTLPMQYQSLEIRQDDIKDEDRSVALSFSSEEPGQRMQGLEILDHSKGAARMERINNGAPLLWNHDPDEQIGVVDMATIGDDKRGHAVVRFGKGPKAQEIFQDVKDGIRMLVSFGYRIHEVTDVERSKEGENSYRVTDWEPFEISLVSIPMDTTVGVGRAGDSGDNVVRLVHTENTALTESNLKQEGNKMSESINNETETRNTAEAAPQVYVPSQADKDKVRKDEINRQAGIRSLGKKFGFDEKAEKAIENGTDLESFRRSVTDTWEAPSAEIDPKGLDQPVGLDASERRDFSVVKAIREIKSGQGLSGLEREVSVEVAKNLGTNLGGNEFFIPAEFGTRDLEAGVDAEGGYSVATEVGGLIEKLDAQLVTASLGATRLTGLRGNVSLPKITGGATASWVDEEGTVSASAQTFGQLALSPKRLSVRTIYSDQLVNQSSLSVENIVRDDLIKREALALDLAALDGTGASNQPTGVTQTSGIDGSVTFGGAATYEDYVNLWKAIAADNAVLDNLAYVTSSASIAKGLTIPKVASTSGMIINEAPGGGFSCMGMPVVMFNQAFDTANIVLFGNWSELVIASWGSRRVTVDPYSAAADGKIAVTTTAFHDIGLKHAESFSVSTDSGAA